MHIKKNTLIAMITALLVSTAMPMSGFADDQTVNRQLPEQLGTEHNISVFGKKYPKKFNKQKYFDRNLKVKPKYSKQVNPTISYYLNTLRGNFVNNEIVDYNYVENDPYTENPNSNVEVPDQGMFEHGFKGVKAIPIFGGYTDTHQIQHTNNTINISENNNEQVYNTDPTEANNQLTMNRQVSVKGNKVRNNIRINLNGNVDPGGEIVMSLYPDYKKNNYKGNMETKADKRKVWDDVNNDFTSPGLFKLGDIFYFVIYENDTPKWIETIRPLNGARMFVDQTKFADPNTMQNFGEYHAVGGKLIDNQGAKVYIVAPKGHQANFAYEEAYYALR